MSESFFLFFHVILFSLCLCIKLKVYLYKMDQNRFFFFVFCRTFPHHKFKFLEVAYMIYQNLLKILTTWIYIFY